MKKALIKVGYSCNQSCIFCHSQPLRAYGDLSTRELESRVAEAAAQGAGMAVFSGGEPTMRRDLAELARAARSRGLKTGLITNARRFIYPAFGAELVGLGLEFVYASFHSHRPRTHALSTRSDTFTQTMGALSNLARLPVELVINTIVTTRNIGDLPEVIDLLAPLRPAKLKFSVVEPKGAALDEPGVFPPLAAAASAIAAALRHGRDRHPGLKFGVEGLTPCLLEDFDALNDDLLTNGFTLFQESFESGFVRPDRLNRAKAAGCVDCSRFEDCPGAFSGYVAAGGASPLRPLLVPRSNSFVYLRDGARRPAPRSARECGARKEDARTIHIAEGRSLLPWRTPTGDFSEAEIDRIRGLGQVYASARGRHTGLDFARDLVKLEVSPLCASCPDRRGCSRLYAPTKRKAFAALESRARSLMRGLKGDVLEIGCGSIRFRSIVESGVRARRLRYVGIDPELPRERRGDGLVLRRCGVEEFEAADGSFDHVVLLRSYNHLKEPSLVFPKLRRMLRPGGRLVVVDGVAFGLAVPRRPAAAAPGAMHHYRNHDSGQARGLLEAMGFRTVREAPVSREGGTEWLLDMRKA